MTSRKSFATIFIAARARIYWEKAPFIQKKTGKYRSPALSADLP
jgi:hypothetical protein